MPSSTDAGLAAKRATEAALLEKIEELSFLRALNDRLARVPDFASACRALVDFVWEERRPDAVAYFSLDPERQVYRLEAAAPPGTGGAGEPTGEFACETLPFPRLDAGEPVVVAEAPPWTSATTAGSESLAGGVLVGAATEVRGVTTGLLVLFYQGGAGASVEEDCRLLPIVATSAALALDAARNQAREEFLATLRHDINNPVSVALGYTEMLIDQLRDEGNGAALGLAASVLESLNVVVDLVSNYLHMAAIDRGMPWLHREQLDLAPLAAEVVDRLSPWAEEKRIALSCRGACPPVRADRRQLGRVITNLVSNALKYTPGPGRVDVTMSTEGRSAALAVADTGYGLAPADLARVFTKYGRFHRQRGIPGTGLGLFISKAIVEAHGGTIAVESAPGHGSTFTVRIPHAAA